jgi:hypothetical protein
MVKAAVGPEQPADGPAGSCAAGCLLLLAALWLLGMLLGFLLLIAPADGDRRQDVIKVGPLHR